MTGDCDTLYCGGCKRINEIFFVPYVECVGICRVLGSFGIWWLGSCTHMCTMVVVVWCAQWVIWCQGFYLNNHPPALMAPLSSGHCTQRIMMTMGITVMIMIANLSMAVSLLLFFKPHIVQILIYTYRFRIILSDSISLFIALPRHSVTR